MPEHTDEEKKTNSRLGTALIENRFIPRTIKNGNLKDKKLKDEKKKDLESAELASERTKECRGRHLNNDADPVHGLHREKIPSDHKSPKTVECRVGLRFVIGKKVEFSAVSSQ